MNSASPPNRPGQSPIEDSALEVFICPRESQLEHGYDSESTNPAQKEVRKKSAPLSFSDSTLQDATTMEQKLLLEESLFNPTNVAGIPQPTSYNTDLDVFNFSQGIPDPLLLDDLNPSPSPDDWMPSPLQTRRGCDLFFAHISLFVPFLHQPTFNASTTPPHLLVSMLSLAYQYAEDPEYGDQESSGANLSLCCFRRAQALIAADDSSAGTLSNNVSLVQSYLLLQICAIMYYCGDYSAYGLKLHSSMISLARAGGLMQPMSIESTATEDLESLWREFIRAETHKRTVFAVHQIDALWYQFFSIPRSISHLEVKHDLPCPEDHWAASSSMDWAHRRLVARNPGPSVPYAVAVRRFISADSDLSSIPPFDPYGAINIAQFLISSAREISGWSSMTGMLSIERFEALRSSLIALSPFIRPQRENSTTAHAAACTATWETAMIELQMWSPSHTGGIVEGSINAVLNQSTSLATSYDFLCENNASEAIQPHVDWFLRYLDDTLVPDSEAPWIALYAYKAFLIAWQLICGGVPGAMHVVGVDDGSKEQALMWARKVFQRRGRWQVGKLVLSCLDELAKQCLR
jgi:hypothetical protein